MKAKVFFDRRELRTIFSLYGKMVTVGEWRDYAIDSLDERAVFSIFRRTSESPLFQVEKRPSEASRRGLYAVCAGNGQVLRRGDEIERVLTILAPRRLRLIGARLAPA
jgi:Protein of unknown function (DUF2794)